MFRMGKRDPTIYCLQVMHLNYKDRLKVNEKKKEKKVNGWKIISHTKSKLKKDETSILIIS